MADRHFQYGDSFVRRSPTRRKQVVSQRPAMPRLLWWLWAIVMFVSGALLTWTLASDADAAGWRIAAGGGGFVVVGMVIIETIWERRQRARPSPTSPPP